MLKTQIVLPLGGNVEQVITSLKNAGVKDLTMVQVVYIHGEIRKDKKPELIYEGPYDDYSWSESQLLVRIGKTLYSVYIP